MVGVEGSKKDRKVHIEEIYFNAVVVGVVVLVY
jgi:hypothetical protein